MFKRICKDEKGAILPFVALFMIFVAFGIVALVIDVGALYNARREMVTAADAAALAGAKEMEKTLKKDADISKITLDAESIASELAIKNGAEVVEVTFEDMIVKYENGTTSFRKVIKVGVSVNQELYFATIFKKNDSEVIAEAVATWGYSKVVKAGQILPLMIQEDAFLSGENFLHDKKMIVDGIDSNANSGFIDLGLKNNLVRDAFQGEIVEFEIDRVIETTADPGLKQHVVTDIKTRMDEAIKLDPVTAKRFMSGIVPVIETINEEEYDNKGGIPPHFPVRVKYFAVFTITDVIDITNSPNKLPKVGVSNALNDSFTDRVTEAREYFENYDAGTIVGVFTGEIIQLYTEIQPDDQSFIYIDQNIETYCKLVK